MQIIFEENCIKCPAFSLLVAIERVNLWQNFFYDPDFHKLMFLTEISVLYEIFCKERIKVRFGALRSALE